MDEEPPDSGLEHLVIGVPGLVKPTEGSMVESLKGMPNIKFFRVPYSLVTGNGNQIVCNFNQETYIQEVEHAYEQALENKRDGEAIGVVASSIGAYFFSKFLAESGAKIDWAFLFSPFVKINPALNRLVNYHLENERDLNISSQFDSDNGVERIIPYKDIIPVAGIDCLQFAKYMRIGEVVTLMGSRDERANPYAIQKFHYALGGTQENLVVFDSGHNLPRQKAIESLRDYVDGRSEVNLETA